MPNPLKNRALPCALVLTLAACNSSTSPPASSTSAAAPISVAAAPSSVSLAPASSATAASAPTASAAHPAPEIVQLNLLDIGVATAKDTFASLKQRYGPENVKDGDVPGAEGEELSGWILYPDDPKRRVYIYLDEAGVHPSLLRALDSESQWQLSDGIRMGLTLTRLVSLNGQKIDFTGFDWDYGGAINDWHHGKMEKTPASGGITLCPPDFQGDQTPENYPMGDATFSSDNDLVRRYPPVICEFGVSLDANPDQP
jgi:hypothetical protein